MPRVCRLLAAIVAVLALATLGVCCYVVIESQPERREFGAFAAGWLPVAVLALRRAALPRPRHRRAAWVPAVVVPAACTGWVAAAHGFTGISPAGYAILTGWVTCQAVALAGLALDGEPRPADEWGDDDWR